MCEENKGDEFSRLVKVGRHQISFTDQHLLILLTLLWSDSTAEAEGSFIPKFEPNKLETVFVFLNLITKIIKLIKNYNKIKDTF